MNDLAIWNLFTPLYIDIDEEDEFYNKKPMLAHYTSLEALEKMLLSEEIWFSNPLFMNDIEEVRFGIFHGTRSIKESKVIRTALQTEARHKIFIESLDYQMEYFEQMHLLDTYVFCLSEHSPDDTDGLLSMWRGYGSNGKGAALVFDMAKVGHLEDSPLIIARVHYGSFDKRYEWFDQITSTIAKLITNNQIPEDKIYIASAAIFERIKLFALFSKHQGFKEENEWRVVYMSDRDQDGKLKSMQYYLNGPRGVEPKLRFKIAPLDGVTPPNISFDGILAKILLGPSTSSPLAIRSVERMLELIGKPQLKDRLVASSIPLRVT